MTMPLVMVSAVKCGPSALPAENAIYAGLNKLPVYCLPTA
eukprot:CAMPEP_0170456328 /NCGR_PEP_ID=MMETSP0123-20130129/4003_1 /TAXON_ID=182087 /ORGANISM="Favella ehrenbergii, Strain Fehren 1" /LENGTH=39 /DNA_ID= /DNA_START= /DNA_END= /DNA_ORIENTATION=